VTGPKCPGTPQHCYEGYDWADPGDTIDTLDHAFPGPQKELHKFQVDLSAIVSIRNPLSAVDLSTLLEVNPRTNRSPVSRFDIHPSIPLYPLSMLLFQIS
jgi:hypothetical protein